MPSSNCLGFRKPNTIHIKTDLKISCDVCGTRNPQVSALWVSTYLLIRQTHIFVSNLSKWRCTYHYMASAGRRDRKEHASSKSFWFMINIQMRNLWSRHGVEWNREQKNDIQKTTKYNGSIPRLHRTQIDHFLFLLYNYILNCCTLQYFKLNCSVW